MYSILYQVFIIKYYIYSIRVAPNVILKIPYYSTVQTGKVRYFARVFFRFFGKVGPFFFFYIQYTLWLVIITTCYTVYEILLWWDRYPQKFRFGPKKEKMRSIFLLNSFQQFTSVPMIPFCWSVWVFPRPGLGYDFSNVWIQILTYVNLVNFFRLL
jgi:hypothetical protein